MKAILRTSDYTENYKIVKIIKNPSSSDKSCAHLLIDGKEYLDNRLLCEYHNTTINVLNNLTPKEQYEWIESIKTNCIVL